MQKHNIKNSVLILMVIILSMSCKKYYFDGGVHEAKYNGTILQYLKDKGSYFDSTVTVIELAGMSDKLNGGEELTFFAPPSGSVYKTMKRLNDELARQGKPQVTKLSQIKQSVWRSTLAQYIFEGSYQLKDIAQRDTLAFVSYPGQVLTSYDGRLMTLGVIYNDEGGVQYAGYRQLYLSYIPDLSNPQTALVNVPVATCNILTNSGVLHVLNVFKHNYGFNSDAFIDQAISAGIDPAN